jgi:type IV pilus assembly protein PilQ
MIAEPLSSSLTVMGTNEQLSLIDGLIHQVDIRRPQVSIELSLVELQNNDTKKLIPTIGTINFGQWNLGLFPSLGGTNLNWRNTVLSQNSKYPITNLSLDSTHANLRGKVLANPNVVVMDGSSSQIDITDEVPTFTTTFITLGNGSQAPQTTVTKQSVGIRLTVSPRVFNDGSVMLQMQPDVSQPSRTVASGGVSTVLVSSRKLNIGQVRVKDGETLVLGGLLREASSIDMAQIPGLGDLPILGAMFRAMNSNSKDKTELVIMVTPHIIKEEAVPYFQPNYWQQGATSSTQAPGPVKQASGPSALMRPVGGAAATPNLPIVSSSPSLPRQSLLTKWFK